MKLLNFNKPYQLFWGSTVLLWLAVLFLPAEAIDIQLHDTYFVIAYYHWALFLTILLGGIGVLYWFFREKGMIRWMTIFHMLITIVPIVVLFILQGFSTGDFANSYIETDVVGRVVGYWILLLLFLLGQIFFIINLLRALFKD